MLCCYVTLQYAGTRVLHIGVYARFRFISQTAACNRADFSNEITKNVGFGENILRSQKEHLGTFVLTFNTVDNICCEHGIFKAITRLITSVKHLRNGNTNKLLIVIWELLISAHF